MKKNNLSKKNGFTLVETMISVMLFSLMAVSIAGAFSGFLKNFVAAKKSQRSSESAQYAMSLMAKTIRNSSMDPLVDINGLNQITMFDNSRTVCVSYKYDPLDGRLKIAVGDVTVLGTPVLDITDCNPAKTPLAFNFASAMTNELDITGVKFYSPQPALKMNRKVTVSMGVSGGTAAAVQTSISLRQ
jgi:prepilin-type N-terminal cleavage/methylation domain-containing protein